MATDFLTRYNEMPLGLKQGVILQKRNGEISFYGGQQLQKFPLIASEDSLLTQRLGDLTLYDREKVTVQSYSVTAGLRKAGGDFAQQFQTTFSQQERQNLIDVYYGNDYACFLFPQELRCSADSEIRKSLPANMVPVALIQNSSNKILSHSGVYLSTRDGSLYQLPAKFSDLQALDPSQWSRTTQPYRLLNLGIIDRGQVIALTQGGKVMTYSAASQQWSSDAALEKSTFVKMLAPFLWSKRLNDL